MAIEKNYIHLTCDRCGYDNYYTSEQYAANIGWGLSLNIPYADLVDLCPKCDIKMSKVVKDFLYGKCDEEEKHEFNHHNESWSGLQTPNN